MNCTFCGVTLPDAARFCPICGSRVEKSMAARAEPERSSVSPGGDRGLREKLLDCYVNFSLSKELSEWLQDLGQVPAGTVEEKLARIRQRANVITVPAESFPRQTIFYLSRYDREILSEICQELGISDEGSKDTLFRRIYHEVGCREGWLQPVPEDARHLIKETFLPILTNFDYEHLSSMSIGEELSDLFGEEKVHIQAQPAHGRAMVVVLIPDLIQEAHVAMFQEGLRSKGLVLA